PTMMPILPHFLASAPAWWASMTWPCCHRLCTEVALINAAIAKGQHRKIEPIAHPRLLFGGAPPGCGWPYGGGAPYGCWPYGCCCCCGIGPDCAYGPACPYGCWGCGPECG